MTAQNPIAGAGGRTMSGDIQAAQLAAMTPYVQRLAENTVSQRQP
jgi:hypothetical protein